MCKTVQVNTTFNMAFGVYTQYNTLRNSCTSFTLRHNTWRDLYSAWTVAIVSLASPTSSAPFLVRWPMSVDVDFNGTSVSFSVAVCGLPIHYIPARTHSIGVLIRSLKTCGIGKGLLGIGLLHLMEWCTHKVSFSDWYREALLSRCILCDRLRLLNKLGYRRRLQVYRPVAYTASKQGRP